MKWEEISELYPGRFILVEALKASSNNCVRQLEDMIPQQKTSFRPSAKRRLYAQRGLAKS
ncbi:hypothetical protein D3C71_1591360 [compost metagenome]